MPTFPPRRAGAAVLLVLLLTACDAREPSDAQGPPAEPSAGTADGDPGGRAGDVSRPGSPEAMPEGVEAISLLGRELRAPALPAEVRATYETNLAMARRGYEAAPENVDSLIWYGRRLAYLGRYRDAIDIYTEGLELHPDEPRLLRHRGHRYITVRQFDDAVADLNRAVRLIDGQEDRVEEDGLPNARGIPTSTLHFNIWYHLGLAHYLSGDLERAVLAWQECLDASRSDDSVVATSYWLHNALRRLELDRTAQEVLSGITPGMDVIESTAYLDVLRLHQGDPEVRSALGLDDPAGGAAAAVAAPGTLQGTTTAYGVALWHWIQGRRETAYDLMEAIVARESQWAAFGYIAAEADLARLDE